MTDAKKPFDPKKLIGEFIFVDGVLGKDKKPRTREGCIQEVYFEDGKTKLVVTIYEGTATQNSELVLDFEEKRWRIRTFGRKQS
jgi:hypothetical protein